MRATTGFPAAIAASNRAPGCQMACGDVVAVGSDGRGMGCESFDAPIMDRHGGTRCVLEARYCLDALVTAPSRMRKASEPGSALLDRPHTPRTPETLQGAHCRYRGQRSRIAASQKQRHPMNAPPRMALATPQRAGEAGSRLAAPAELGTHKHVVVKVLK
ncbi:uncharacterized protein BDZ99DRAFT_459434 [Mytilinidion resinicola]|uniref:Uncharacterized protein n=1 Tax=Mytilinidion resinicola TaxID=574789 RepID=A0A6A6Z065_9PEZI|nr:uncharacterized protein BDZ99DRAFT_459434 [Mytilinidion resinicola]KAF2813654.1 hypothetical protein BDZ99DRAFT_459434 [Mytilinidion resinicola]